MSNAREFQAQVTADIRRQGKNIGKILDSKDMKQLGDLVTREIRTLTSKGISPLDGKRMPAYKNPDRYPGPRKRPRPVNLRLSGKFMKSLQSWFKLGRNAVLTIGYKNSKSLKKEQGHREGAGGQPLRPTIPLDDETFSRGIRTKFNRLLDGILKRK